VIDPHIMRQPARDQASNDNPDNTAARETIRIAWWRWLVVVVLSDAFTTPDPRFNPPDLAMGLRP
jgi:hypothetical protein